MATIIANVIQEIEFWTSSIVIAVSTAFQIAAGTGQILYNCVAFLYSAVVGSLSSLQGGASVLVDESLLFLSDTRSTGAELVEMLCRFAGWSYDSAVDLGHSTQQGAAAVWLGLFLVLETCRDLSALLWNSLKGCIILAGDGTLYLVQLVPLTVFGLVSSIFSVFEALWQAAARTCSCGWKLALDVHREVTDFPVTTLVGLALAAVLSAGARRYLRSVHWPATWRWLETSRRLRSTWHRLRQASTTAFQSEQQQQQTQQEQTLLEQQLQRERDEKLCVVCRDRPRCVLLMPCRHFCLCDVCVDVLAQHSVVCPICRRHVLDHIRVYP